MCFFSKREPCQNGRPLSKAVVFLGPPNGPLCASNLRAFFFNKKCENCVRLKGKEVPAIHPKTTKKSIGLQPSSDVSILEKNKETPPESHDSPCFFCEAIGFSKSRLDLYLDPAGHPFIPGGAHFYCK